MRFTVREYLAADGSSPFRRWLGGLDPATRARIQARLFRFELGNLGDHKSVGEGVLVARVQFGAGSRIYFGKVGRSIILLLAGGDKATQKQDIRQARRNWNDYFEEQSDGKT